MKLSIIVVGIKHSGNLGALARLCSNYGVSKLIAVAPECDIDDEAYQRATWGRPYLDNLIIVNNLDETKSHVETLIGFHQALEYDRESHTYLILHLISHNLLSQERYLWYLNK